MGALIVVNYDITGLEGFQGYRELAGPILIGEGKATPIAASSDTLDLGEGIGVAGTIRFDAFVSREGLGWEREAQTRAPQKPLERRRLSQAFPVESG